MHRFIISGGGTGGHIFPALAIANGIKEVESDAEILFVGAEGKMEMEKVPLAGYEIIGLPISGLQRSLTWKNVLFPFRVMGSYFKAHRIIRDFKPDIAIGVGGYASWPTVSAAAHSGVKTMIQEQNSLAGLANKRLGKNASMVCVAYDGMERFFPASKIIQTGNPVRSNLKTGVTTREARKHFRLDEHKPTILVFGGSLGAGTLNEAMANAYELLVKSDVQFIWQIGKFYADKYLPSESGQLQHVDASVFIDRMDLAYAAADLVICRAGALTISEICLLGKASILVPSPNVAEDHQTKNAEALVRRGAAVMIKDSDAKEQLIVNAFKMIHDKVLLNRIEREASTLGKPDATKDIVEEIFKIIN